MTELKPQISICIPTYNGEKFIARTIQVFLIKLFLTLKSLFQTTDQLTKLLE